ncbi:MAG TPA: ATP-binding cassette domain-containing protein [Anaerolineaceae bacterium]|nr:ATP-binding cassette domain-containing protein [Anaerolineaceae bacterium]HOH18894.1 ATP-binding cassette domain-containing protein [Anaerolineaceae bacterium]HPA32494.1 ATP-binding cassette domain-containing protein [Anaerolineaceae bacterium]HQL38912.1 ATP-binding cassette domain-containing protein [Anaerolineaceae bacterium]
MHRRSGKWGAWNDFFHPQYRTIRAVDGISFDIQPGELIGYIGPNGAGKSTTIKMLTGLLVPTGGEILVKGMIPWKDRRKYVANIGVVFGQRRTLWWDLPVIDSLEVLKAIYRIPDPLFKHNLGMFRKILDLDSFLESPVRSLSLGQRMRAELCAAFLHNPALLFLDEPTIGLDVVAKERIREFIRHLHREGTTILLTTHDLTDVERLCERVMVLDWGKILYDGNLQELTSRFEGVNEMRVSFAENGEDGLLEGLEPPVREGRYYVYRIDPRKVSIPDLVSSLYRTHPVVDLEIRKPKLEDTIRKIYENKSLNTPD